MNEGIRKLAFFLNNTFEESINKLNPKDEYEIFDIFKLLNELVNKTMTVQKDDFSHGHLKEDHPLKKEKM